MFLTAIEEEDYILPYLQRRGLVEQFRKAKQQLLLWIYSGVKLKQRVPKNS